MQKNPHISLKNLERIKKQIWHKRTHVFQKLTLQIFLLLLSLILYFVFKRFSFQASVFFLHLSWAVGQLLTFLTFRFAVFPPTQCLYFILFFDSASHRDRKSNKQRAERTFKSIRCQSPVSVVKHESVK